MGQGPLIVFVHGFPDFWYSWRHQMQALAKDYRCVAIDQRGFNLSDKPAGQENYVVEKLTSDIAAVIAACGAERATVVGHDWGGFVAWWFAAFRPDLTERLVVCNLPHPKCFSRELATNPEQKKMSEYAQAFRREDAGKSLDKDLFATFAVGADQAAFPAYRAAMANSDIEAMLNYYKANYPALPYTQDAREVPLIKAPVLQFHGLKDPALHADGLNNTWEWLENTLTLVTAPNAAHWVHTDAPELVSNTIADWLKRN
jgi:pimeloyl-ACP methyl ester carboxylesterase